MEKISASRIVIAIFLLAFLLRLPEFFSSLAYDEIWTLSNFAPLKIRQLLFDLELPNNHPLNSILIKFIASFDPPVEFIRLPNLLANLGSIALVGIMLKRFYGQVAAWMGMVFMSINAPLVVFSMQARGYSLQIFFLLLFAYGIIALQEKDLSKKRRWIFSLLIVLGSSCAMITLPTSSLYLAGIVLILWNYKKWGVKNVSGAGVIVLAGVLALLYILLNYHGLMAARKWGTALSGSREFFCWLGETLYWVLPGGVLPFTLWGIWCQRKNSWGLAAALLLIFLSACFTNGGGARVYLPLTVLAAFYGAIGFAGIYARLANSGNKRKIITLAAILLSAGSYVYQLPLWKLPNYHPLLAEVEKIPSGTLIIYPAGDSYPVLWNSQGKAAQYYSNSLQDQSLQRTLLLINRNSVISGADETFAEKNLPLPFSGKLGKLGSIPITEYTLQKVTGDFPADRPLIAVLHLVLSKSTFQSYSKSLQELVFNKSDILLLNCFFCGAELPDNRRLWSGCWYIAPGALRQRNYEKLPEKLSGVISFYQIVPGTQH